MNKYNWPKIIDELEVWLAEGQTLRAFCRLKGKPSWRCIYDQLLANEQYSSRITRARLLGADAIAEEALEIANTPIEGVITKQSEKGTEITREDMLGHRKLQVETRLKLLAKWFPQKYGDKQTLEHTGNVSLTVEQVDAAVRAALLQRPVVGPGEDRE